MTTPISFPPEVLARIAPDISLQRHLSLGIRPCLRKFDEFKNVEYHSSGNVGRYGAGGSTRSTVLGSSSVKSGNTVIFCQITGGLLEVHSDEEIEQIREYEKIYEDSSKKTEQQQKSESQISGQYATVYPIIEIERAKYGPPTDEEMLLGQLVHDGVFYSRILPQKSLQIEVPVMSEGTIVEGSKKKYQYVLHASVQIFSRNGPLLDLVWGAVIKALEVTRLPRAYIDEDISTISSLQKSNAVRHVICDTASSDALQLKNGTCRSTTIGVTSLDARFAVPSSLPGITKPKAQQPILLCDIEGEAEEAEVASRVSVLAGEGEDDDLCYVSIVGGGVEVTENVVRDAIKLAKLRL